MSVNDVAIRAVAVGKRYRLGDRGRYKALRDSIAELPRVPLRIAGSLAKRGGGVSKVVDERQIWALQNVSFSVRTGEVLGVIGRNGAGKSTLLKVLSRVTEPTSGRIELRGRVASLLEVGTGFHPELTGRDNLYLSGAVLGMSRQEIHRKFDEIVEFAGVERFLETPVKRYSSGMEARLGFAVAAHLEPDILLVDEVLAVGDAEFQKRCMGKMDDVAREGRTVLFVSHNMTAINQLCPRTILLSEGRVALDGPTASVVPEYLRTDSEGAAERNWRETGPGNDRIRLHAVRVVSDGIVRGEVEIDKEVSIEVEYWNLREGLRNVSTDVYLIDEQGTVVLNTATRPRANALPEEWFGAPHPAGLFRSTCTFPANFLNEGTYYISVFVVTLGPIALEAEAQEVVSFSVFDTGAMREPGGGERWDGVIRPRLPWTTELVESAEFTSTTT